MTNREYREAENILYCHAAGQVTAAWVRRELAKFGLAADLRTWCGNTVDVTVVQTGEIVNVEV